MSPRDEALTGLAAAQRLLAEAEREEFVAVELVARALRCSRRRLLREWQARGYHVVRIGYQTQIATSLVIATYFRHRLAARPEIRSTQTHLRASTTLDATRGRL